MTDQVDYRSIAGFARNLIEVHGWRQHEFGNKKKGFCLFGAFFEAMDEFHLLEEERKAAWDFMRSRMPGKSLIEWNDEPGRTKEEVLSLLDAAARTSDVVSEDEG